MKAGLTRFGKYIALLLKARRSLYLSRESAGARLLHDRLVCVGHTVCNMLTDSSNIAQEALTFGIVDAILEKRPEDRNEQESS